MVTRHSWHTPMPHKGARNCPLTERRVTPAMAAATVVPGATVVARLSMVKVMTSTICPPLHIKAARQIRARIDPRLAAGHLRRQQFRGCERGCNAKSFVAGRQPEIT